MMKIRQTLKPRLTMLYRQELIRAEKRVAILAILLISLVSYVPSARGTTTAHIAVPQAPLTVGDPVYITYYTDGPNGAAFFCIRQQQVSIWKSATVQIVGGIAYDVTAPRLPAPGTYPAGVIA